MTKKAYFRRLASQASLAFGIGLASFAAQSETSEPEAPFHPTWEFGGTIGVLNIDEQSASRELIEDDALSIGFFADYVMETWLISLGFDFASYDDNAEFSQEVRTYYGRYDDRSSDATGFLMFGAIGPKWQFGDTLITVQGGYAHMIESERSISYCSNCRSEDIDIDGGVFARAGIRQNAGPVAIGLNYTQYISNDDLENKFEVSISTAY